MTAELRDDHDELVGTEIHGYRIEEEIGRGGMGAVYRATQAVSNAEVAIKVLARDLVESRESAERFVNEARIANRVRHEGVVKVLFVGLLPDGRPYLIMEHLTGTPLSALIGTQLPLGTLLHRLAEAMHAIAAMHDAGIIHRDLKPGNLFVTTAGFIKVLDFGIAKLADETSGLTRTGHTIGTPGYMSPEQAEADPLDARSDVYSLGVVIYECVTGRRPFEGRALEALAARERPPILPDPAVNAVVQKAMAPDRHERFSTVLELADALETIAPALPDGVLTEAPLAIETVPPTVRANKAIERLGRYIVEGTAGRGGEGVVLVGHDPKVQRKVALKVLDAGARRDRVIAEAQAMARVSHPNVVTLYELGEDGDRLFLAMEYLDATDLERWLDDGHAWRAIVEMFVAAGRGLAAAHAVGVVHRDFKPANVLLGKDGRPRVGDFGIAEIGPSSGNAAGTAAFMAPEQVEGGTVDARADQFAFCAALWRALHGEAPYSGSTAVAIAMAAQRGELRDPKGDVPNAVTVVLKRGLAASPDDRFADMTALLAALERAMARRRIWPFVVIGIGAIGVVTLLATRGSVEERPFAPPSLAEIRRLDDPMEQLRALAELPIAERWTPEARMLARAAAKDGIVRRITLEVEPLAEAASFARDGTLVVPTATSTLAIARDGTQRTLPAPPQPPRKVVLDERELRVLTDDAILATPLDRFDWKPRAKCNYAGIHGKRAEADAELTMLACIGVPSRILVDGKASPIAIDRADSVAFTPDRRIVVRREQVIELFDPRSATELAHHAVVSTHVAAAADLVAFLEDGKVGLWNPATNEVAATSMAAQRLEVIGGREPVVLATTGGDASVMYIVRKPTLGRVDLDLLAGGGFVAGDRVIHLAKQEVVVRDFATGRAWRQPATHGAVIADARAMRLALFDRRVLRLWSLDVPAAASIGHGLPGRTEQNALIVTEPGWISPLRAYSGRGELLDRIDTPAQLLDGRNRLLVARDGKTWSWTPATKQLTQVADQVLDRGFIGDEAYGVIDGKLARARDREPVCPGPIWTGTPDGAVALTLADGKLFACRPQSKRTVELAASPRLAADSGGGRASWYLRPDGRVAAGLSAGTLALFDTETGAAIELTGVAATVSDLAFAPSGDRIAVIADQGLVIVEGNARRLLASAVYKQPRFVDVAHLAVLRGERVELWDLTTGASSELGALASTDRNTLSAIPGYAIAISRHLTTGVAVSFPIEPPDLATVETWFASLRK